MDCWKLILETIKQLTLAAYQLSGDTIKFIDKEGKMCQDAGQYKVYQNKYYMSLDLIEDECGGRIKSTMVFLDETQLQRFNSTA